MSSAESEMYMTKTGCNIFYCGYALDSPAQTYNATVKNILSLYYFFFAQVTEVFEFYFY